MDSETKEQVNLLETEDLLSNNVFEFKYKEKDYRVIKASFRDKQEVLKKKVQKFTELLKNKDILLEKDLIKLYKERGVDIDEIDKAITNLEQSKNSYKEKLGEALSKGSAESDLIVYKKEIEDIIEKQLALYNQRYSMIQYSLESQVRLYAYTYISIFMVEHKVEDKWVRLWNTFEEFENFEDEEFTSTVAVYIGTLLKNEVF